MKESDSFLQRIEDFNLKAGGGVSIHRSNGGYNLYTEVDGSPIARLRPTGVGDEVEVLWRSHRDKWEPIGEFGTICLPLDEALEYIAEDPMGCFWIWIRLSTFEVK